MSIIIIVCVIFTLLLNSSTTDLVAIVSIFTILSLYVVLFIKHRNLEHTIDSEKLLEPINTQNYIKHSSGYATVDELFNVIDFNKEFLEECSYENKSLLGKNLFDILPVESTQVLKKIRESGNFKGTLSSSDENKKLFYSLIIKPSSNEMKKEYFIVFNEITESMRDNYLLEENYVVDKFTGLATKSKLLNDIENIKKPAFGRATLIYLNIEAFDEINEYFGIDAGNRILSHVAKWLNKELPTTKARLYKLDLNSFAILITDRFSLTKLNEYLKKISTNIEKENFYFKRMALNISITMGVARCKKDIVKCAYLALKDTQNLKKPYKIYDKTCQHQEKFVKNIKMNQTIKDAILEKRIVPFFQPIYNLKTDKIEKFESLIRIQNRNESYLRPIDFLDIARKSRLYNDLSKEMIKSSFDRLQTVKLPITINISMNDILDKRTSNFILRRLNTNNLGHLVTFELVESEEIINHIKVVNFIKKIKLLGCKIAIDDFGSGYSNFGQLLKLDIDYLKIDGSLIKDINTNKNSEIITKSIISLAKEMGIETIAEFVTSKEIFDKVKLLGIDYAQGYHIGKPSLEFSKI
jgi:diguanylate cyclase (GGDEF)-like protein